MRERACAIVRARSRVSVRSCACHCARARHPESQLASMRRRPSRSEPRKCAWRGTREPRGGRKAAEATLRPRRWLAIGLGAGRRPQAPSRGGSSGPPPATPHPLRHIDRNLGRSQLDNDIEMLTDQGRVDSIFPHQLCIKQRASLRTPPTTSGRIDCLWTGTADTLSAQARLDRACVWSRLLAYLKSGGQIGAYSSDFGGRVRRAPSAKSGPGRLCHPCRIYVQQ